MRSRLVHAAFAAILAAGGVLLPALAAAGDESRSGWLVRTWQTDEGLPDNRIANVMQAADGYVWVATFGGLMRFDGVRFEERSTFHITKQPNQNVRGLLQDHRGRMWLAMDLDMVICVDGSEATMFDISEGVVNPALRAMAEDGEGAIWIVRRNTISRILNGKVERFGESAGLPPGEHAWVAADTGGTLWFARGPNVGKFQNGRFVTVLKLDAANVSLAPSQDGGLWIVTPSQLMKFSEGSPPREVARMPPRSTVRAILEDREGAVWIGTSASGLFRWSSHGLEAVDVPRPQITALAQDREGNLWVGTDGGGLYRVRPRAIGYIGKESGLPPEAVKTVCQDSDGCLWAVLQYGALARESGGRWHVMAAADGWPGGNAVCVSPDRNGGVWVGMRDRGLFRWRGGKTDVWGPENGFDIRSVRSLLSASNKDVWIVTDWPNRLRLFREGRLFDLKVPRNMQAMIALAEGPDGTIWAGVSNGQLFRVHGLEMVREAGAEPEHPCYVKSLHAMEDGSLWIGYEGAGLGRWWKGRYACMSDSQGLYDHHISQIRSDGSGRLWMTGNRGLFYAQVEELTKALDGETNRIHCVFFGRGEGLPNLQPMWQFSPTDWRTKDGRLLFAVGNGLLEVCPDAIRENPVAPFVTVEGVRVDERIVAKRNSGFALDPRDDGAVPDLRALAAPLALPPDYDKIEIDYTALSFSSPENVRFRHRMKGFDRAWVEAGTRRDAVYSRLPAGRYLFELAACNESGVWAESDVRIPIKVKPFLWQTWWAHLLIWAGALFLVAGVVAAVLRRRHQMRMQTILRRQAVDLERTRIARDMHDQLGSGLTKAGMITEALRRETGAGSSAHPSLQMLRETLDHLTVTMDELVWAVNARHDTLDGLASYVIRFTQEFLAGTSISCVLDVPADLPAVTVSAPVRHNLFLAFEEALSNAARHAQATEVKVKMTYGERQLVLEVADNGCGFDVERVRAGAHGLENMRNRLITLGGRCEFETSAGHGTRVRFDILLEQ